MPRQQHKKQKRHIVRNNTNFNLKPQSQLHMNKENNDIDTYIHYYKGEA